MKTYTITQKQSGTGTIHDLASQHHDRVIKFREGDKYAVVLAAFYGGTARDSYTTHKTEQGAIRAAKKLSKDGYSFEILDQEGGRMINYYDERLIAE